MAKKSKVSIPDDAEITNNNLVESFGVKDNVRCKRLVSFRVNWL